MPMVWQFAEFELDPDNHVLRKSGQVVKLPPQPFKVLLVLVSRSGALVRREELRQILWDEGVTVDFEHGLNTCMRHVRAALGDDAQAPRIIETVPRVGYRLKVPVTQHTERRYDLSMRSVGWTAAAAICAATLAVLLLRPDVTPSDHASAVSESHALYVRGRASLERGSQADIEQARRLFSEAARLDPASSQAHAGTALSYLTHPLSGAGVPPTEGRALAARAAERSAALDDANPMLGVATAELKLRAGDWIGAEQEFQRTIERAPTNAAVREAYANVLALHGRFDDAMKEARTAQALDPLSPRMVSTLASVLRFARRYQEAIAEAERALSLDPTFGPALHTLGLSYQALGQVDRAIEFYEREGQPSGNLGHAYAVAGRVDDARRLLRHFETRYDRQGSGAGAIAQIYVGLGEHDRAFEWLARQVDTGAPTTLRVAEIWDPLRPDPRFQDLLAKLDGRRELER